MSRVRVVTRDNGAGLSRDLRLVADVLRQRAHVVATTGFGASKAANLIVQANMRAVSSFGSKADVQLSLERVYPRLFPTAKRHILVPNPEWFQAKWLPFLGRFDEVLCKTRHAMPIFERLGCRTRYIGFTSEDRFDAEVAREHRFFHLAGRSSAKGTAVVLEAWCRHPEWPLLTVVQNSRKVRHDIQAENIDFRAGYLDDAELKNLQNACMFHICPSEMEGYGHYLVEGLSVGAVVLTTDAAPMNELVGPDRGILLHCTEGGAHGLDSRKHVSMTSIEQGVEHALALDTRAIDAIRWSARKFYLENDRAFRGRLADAVA